MGLKSKVLSYTIETLCPRRFYNFFPFQMFKNKFLIQKIAGDIFHTIKNPVYLLNMARKTRRTQFDIQCLKSGIVIWAERV